TEGKSATRTETLAVRCPSSSKANLAFVPPMSPSRTCSVMFAPARPELEPPGRLPGGWSFSWPLSRPRPPHGTYKVSSALMVPIPRKGAVMGKEPTHDAKLTREKLAELLNED